jgi:hypothetical protein
MHDLIRRQRAVEACVSRFVSKPLDFKVRDCVRLVRHDLHHMGHGTGLLKGVRWGTAPGALKAMRKLGFDDLMQGMDATGLARIPPAMALPADILALPAEGGFGCALAVFAGNDLAIGYIDGHDVGVRIRLETPPLAAWSVI